MKQRIKVTESDLHNIIKESVVQVLNEYAQVVAALAKNPQVVSTVANMAGGMMQGGGQGGGMNNMGGGMNNMGNMSNMISGMGGGDATGPFGAVNMVKGMMSNPQQQSQQQSQQQPQQQQQTNNQESEETTTESKNRYKRHLNLSESYLKSVVRESLNNITNSYNNATSTYGDFNWSNNNVQNTKPQQPQPQQQQSQQQAQQPQQQSGGKVGGNASNNFDVSQLLNNPNLQKYLTNLYKGSNNFKRDMRNGGSLRDRFRTVGNYAKQFGRGVGKYAQENPEQVQQIVNLLSSMR